MESLVLRTATRYLLPLQLMFSVFVLLRGHNEPGGGFVGGLVAATAFALYAVAYDVRSAQRALYFSPRRFMGVGLGLAVLSGILSLLAGDPFLTAQWSSREIPVIGKPGTPLLFDIGVYLAVIGVTLSIIFVLAEERN